MNELAERLRKVPTPAVSDVQQSLGPMHAAIKSIVPGAVAAGPAFTVKAYPGSIITVHKALLEAKPGDVLVVDGEGDDRGALIGELMSLQCQQLGLAGVVVDGPVRDAAAVRELGFPLFARSLTPRVGTNRRIGQTQVTLSCGGQVVRPGDWILADDDGVVVIPAENLESVLAAAEQKVAKEKEWAERIKGGELIADILSMRDTIYPKS